MKKFERGQIVYDKLTDNIGTVIECNKVLCTIEIIETSDKNIDVGSIEVYSTNNIFIAYYYIIESINDDLLKGNSNWVHYAETLILNNVSLNDLIRLKKETTQTYIEDVEDVFDIDKLWDIVIDVKAQKLINYHRNNIKKLENKKKK